MTDALGEGLTDLDSDCSREIEEDDDRDSEASFDTVNEPESVSDDSLVGDDVFFVSDTPSVCVSRLREIEIDSARVIVGVGIGVCTLLDDGV